MAKTIATTTLSPLVFYRAPVLADHQQDVVEQQNFVVGRRPVVYLNTNGAPARALESESPGANTLWFPVTLNAWLTKIRGHARVNADVQSLRISARCWFAAASAGEIRFTIGSSSATLSVATADNNARVNGSLLTSATGTGLLQIQIELRCTLNALAETHYAYNLRVQGMVIAAADLPDPANS